MAASVSNPAFPHFCVVRRYREVDSFTPDNPFEPENLDEEGFPLKQPREKVIYAGRCRRDFSTNIRTFKTGSTTPGQVVYNDFRVSIPGHVKIRPGDVATVEHGAGKDEKVTVLNVNYSSLRTKLYPEGHTEFFYSKPGI